MCVFADFHVFAGGGKTDESDSKGAICGASTAFGYSIDRFEVFPLTFPATAAFSLSFSGRLFSSGKCPNKVSEHLKYLYMFIGP